MKSSCSKGFWEEVRCESGLRSGRGFAHVQKGTRAVRATICQGDASDPPNRTWTRPPE